MTKVLIADDELLPRIGLKSLLDWGQYGYAVIGECEDGQSALEAIREKQPDIVITDMKMPVIDGVELIRRVKQERIPCKFIVLSGYDDFDFVREALLLGAEDYLLKLEMTQGKLLKSLEKARDSLQKERDMQEEQQKKEAVYSKAFYEMKRQFLRDCLRGAITEEELIVRRMEELFIDLPPKNLICVMLRFQNFSSGQKPLLHTSVLNALAKVSQEYGKAEITDIGGLAVAVISLTNRDPSALRRLSDSLRFVLKNMLNLEAEIVCSSVFDGYGGLSGGFQAAEKLLRSPSGQAIPMEPELRALEKDLNACRRRESVEDLDRILERVRKSEDFFGDRLDGVCYTIIFLVNGFCSANQLDRKTLFPEHSPYEAVRSMETPDDCARWIERLKEALEGVLLTENTGGNPAAVIRIKRYVNDHLKEELSLDTIAADAGLSPSYLSRMFCRQTGMNLIAYINECRVKRAKELLRDSNLKIYEVSQEVGFENPHYFSRIFKRHTGMTPYEYRSK